MNIIGALLGTTLLTISMFADNINSDPYSRVDDTGIDPQTPSSSRYGDGNATFHKRKDTQSSTLLEYLPPYSPDLNPIERKWAQT